MIGKIIVNSQKQLNSLPTGMKNVEIYINFNNGEFYNRAPWASLEDRYFNNEDSDPVFVVESDFCFFCFSPAVVKGYDNALIVADNGCRVQLYDHSGSTAHNSIVEVYDNASARLFHSIAIVKNKENTDVCASTKDSYIFYTEE